MPNFNNVTFDINKCQLELQDFYDLLANNTTLSERNKILPFFRNRLHLSSLVGLYNNIINADRIAHEYDLYGEFRADLVVGDGSRSAYCFVEFENADDKSIFVTKTTRTTPFWSQRFLGAFSQVADWFWKLDDSAASTHFVNTFGSRQAIFVGVIVAGRRADLQAQEMERLRWFSRTAIVNNQHIVCCTFDDLYDDLSAKLTSYIDIASAL